MDVVVDIFTQLGNVVLGQILDTRVGIHPGGFKNLLRGLPANAENIGQPDFDPLILGQVNASYTSHTSVAPPLFGLHT